MDTGYDEMMDYERRARLELKTLITASMAYQEWQKAGDFQIGTTDHRVIMENTKLMVRFDND